MHHNFETLGAYSLKSSRSSTVINPSLTPEKSDRDRDKKGLKYRICHLSKYYPPVPGGIETHVQTLARAQADLGAEVVVLCVNPFDSNGNFTATTNRTETIEEMDGKVRVIRLGRLASIARLDICPALPKKLCQVTRNPNTLLHIHTPNPTMLIAMLALRKRVPLVVTHHSDIIKQKILKYALRPFQYFVYGKASSVLATSSQYITGSKFLQTYKKNLDYLPLGLDSSRFRSPNAGALSFAAELKRKYEGPIWLSAGRVVYYKALHVAIEALTKVPGRLIMVGSGPLQGELKALAKELGVEDRVIWLGRVSDDELVGAYHAATALWFPSNARSEGFGLVQVEAMASGCPVINANIICSGVPWVSRHEKEALTVPINDSVAFAGAAQRLLDEPGLRDRLVAAGRKRAAYFNEQAMAERSLEIYSGVLSKFNKKLAYPGEGR